MIARNSFFFPFEMSPSQLDRLTKFLTQFPVFHAALTACMRLRVT